MCKNIAISGDVGTGKTTLSNNLVRELGWKHLNAGDFFREWHLENNIPLIETERVPEEIDRKVDGDYQKMLQTKDKTIFESRLAGFLSKDYPDTLRVLCRADFNEVVKRVSKRRGVSAQVAKEDIKIRSEALKRKFKKLYGVEDYLDPKYFNLVVDTTTKTPEQVLEEVIKALTSN